MNIKTCSNCKKRFVLAKGFYKDSKGVYRSQCKSCHNKASGEIQKKNKLKEGYKYHSFNENDICERCGLKRRRKATRQINRWFVEYFVNNIWTSEHPDCLKEDNI